MLSCLFIDYELKTLVSDKRVLRPSIDMFTCGNGIQIPYHLRCNGRFNCEDKSDETECLDVYTGKSLSHLFSDKKRYDVNYQSLGNRKYPLQMISNTVLNTILLIIL